MCMRHKSIFSRNKHTSITNKHTVTDNTLSNIDINKSSTKTIEEIMQKLKESSSYMVEKYENKNISRLLENISNMKYNQSLYRLSDLESIVSQHNKVKNVTKQIGVFTRRPLQSFSFTTKNIKQFLKSTRTSTSSLASTSDAYSGMTNSSENEMGISTNVYNLTFSSTNKNNITTRNEQNTDQTPSSIVYETITVNKTTESVALGIISTHGTKPATGTMVDHESWENVVQAAPVMAVLLNQTVTDTLANYTGNTTHDTTDAASKLNGTRIKRKIQPIPIENARPHNLTTKEVNTTTPIVSYDISDRQEALQLVELQDDELYERRAMRYLRKYVGPVMFNICDYGEPKARHVYLFNASKIVLAITNFTLERMTVMLTPANTLLSGNSRCSSGSLECQVYGTRICIDSMNACDGVPNCGAYDIYDEDRLMCGAAVGLQHNVYLAAVTFLAVLLTMMYTVHYWLRRCVPKVSEAFFIYTDGAENILYLDSIMRSPHDIYMGPKMAYQEPLFGDIDYLSPDTVEKPRKNVLYRIIYACFNCCKRKRRANKLSEIIDEPFYRPKEKYSFMELELSKMNQETTTVAVQTGDSLEIPRAETKKITPQFKSLPDQPKECRRMAKVAVSSDEDLHKHISELNMLRLFKEFKSDKGASASIAAMTRDSCETASILVQKTSFEEEELQSHYYDTRASDKPGPSRGVIPTTTDKHSKRAKVKKSAKKHLRFEPETTTIPSFIDEDDDEDYEGSNIISLDKKKKTQDVDKLDTPHSTGGGRDFKRFWKSKKIKKKTHLSLHTK
ncbi:uncharacterized protein LOC135086472 [Ostrinia nubilalis]|uniref:uncharacterized protein LOC135086472 n=1 Tax=Ostrinia nubilalis TaxID=29057 RepID=UPI0030823C49